MVEKTFPFKIEGGDYCLKYNDWIFYDTVKRCEEDGFHPKKGCVGGNCPFRTYKVEVERSKDGKRCIMKGGR